VAQDALATQSTPPLPPTCNTRALESPTKIEPAPSATDMGPASCADVAGPGVPAEPVDPAMPASTRTELPDALTTRTTALPKSAITYRFAAPCAGERNVPSSNAMPAGVLNDTLATRDCTFPTPPYAGMLFPARLDTANEPGVGDRAADRWRVTSTAVNRAASQRMVTRCCGM